MKVFEPNIMTALRTGQMAAQSPLAQVDYAGGSAAQVENGYILYLVGDKLVSPGNLPSGLSIELLQPAIHYTEELFLDNEHTLNSFALEWNDDNVAYPRALFLNVGDVFTTDNHTVWDTDAVYARVDDNGQFVPFALAGGSVDYSGPLFAIEVSTLPDGETDAYEYTYLGMVSTAAGLDSTV